MWRRGWLTPLYVTCLRHTRCRSMGFTGSGVGAPIRGGVRKAPARVGMRPVKLHIPRPR